MQFPVPQYTDVEDRIIGPVTVKQFFILLAAALVIFFSYSLTKDYYVTGAAVVIVGIPAVLVAFMPFNGRPMYASAISFLNFLTRPRLYIFRKQALQQAKIVQVSDLKTSEEDKPSQNSEDARNKLKKIQYQLEQRAKQEEEVLNLRK